MSEPSIGFVGAGKMGLPMVARLVGAGRAPLVLARRPEVAAAVQEAGATPVPTLDGLAGCDLVLVCVFDAAQLDDVMTGPQGLLEQLRPGSAVVSHATVGRSDVERIAELCRGRGIEFLDAPISGTETDIAAGRLTVLIGGSDDAVDRCEPVLSAYSSTIVRTGRAGTATALKLINNALLAANFQLAATAVRLAESAGVSERLAMAAFEHCSGDSVAMHNLRTGAPDGLDAYAAQVSRYLRKDVAAARTYASEYDEDLGVIESTITNGPLALEGT